MVHTQQVLVIVIMVGKVKNVQYLKMSVNHQIALAMVIVYLVNVIVTLALQG